ncbi:hypothetical protein LCGC14_1634440 [marine sediment metagenome]|uniref:Uncharacterized protein n=1 Tax=marine sediment metagenome TaxID=412755 RepID=A0A0F9I1Q5_9ZZZZ
MKLKFNFGFYTDLGAWYIWFNAPAEPWDYPDSFFDSIDNMLRELALVPSNVLSDDIDVYILENALDAFKHTKKKL